MPDLTNYEYDIFLSHNHRDQEWTTKLAERLEQEDWQGRKLKVFFSPWDIRPGQSIPKEIEKALPKSRKVGLVLSPDAMASAWVELERLVTTYIDISERDERLIPLLRKQCGIPALLRPILSIDFTDDKTFESNYQTLLTVIKDEPLPRGSRASAANAKTLSPLIPRPPIVGFVARRDSEGHDIVERLKKELAPEKNQLIVLSGPGGVGKTTLAAETARALAKDFQGRMVWTSALGREDFSLSTLLDDIATQLNRVDLRPLPVEAKAEQVQAVIAEAPALMVLDNFETIAETEQIRCVDFLANRASCPALITSRQKIGLARNITISVMSAEEADKFLHLLIDQTGNPTAFEQLDRDRIYKESERNPLVLQWVVAQIDLAQDAETVLEELSQGQGDAAQRVFDRSFGLTQLGDDGRATLMALCLFAPDASRPALAEVAGFGDDVKRLNEAVKRLAGLWLVKATSLGQRLMVEGLTRQLAKARLSRDVRADEIRQRFVSYFVRYAENHAKATAEDYESLEDEKDNLLGAIDMAFDSKNWDNVKSISFDLTNPISGMLYIHGYWDEAIHRGKQALEAAKATNDQYNIGAFANGLGVIFAEQGDYSSARKYYELAAEIARRLNVKQGLAATLNQLGTLAHRQGELEDARKLYDESLEIDNQMGNKQGVAGTLHNLAAIAQRQGEPDKARRLYVQSMDIQKELGNQPGIANTLHGLGRLAQDQRD